MKERGKGRRTSRRGRERGASRTVILPPWADKAFVGAADVIGVTVSEICRTLLIAPAVLDATVPPEMAVVAAYTKARDAIAEVRVREARMRWEAVVPSDATETIGLKPDAPTE